MKIMMKVLMINMMLSNVMTFQFSCLSGLHNRKNIQKAFSYQASSTHLRFKACTIGLRLGLHTFFAISSAERSCGNIDSPYQVLSPAVFHGNALFLEEGEGEGRPGMWKY